MTKLLEPRYRQVFVDLRIPSCLEPTDEPPVDYQFSWPRFTNFHLILPSRFQRETFWASGGRSSHRLIEES